MVRAAVQVGPRQIELQTFPRPTSGPDDGPLRIERCGICGSDVEQFKGELGRRQYPSRPFPAGAHAHATFGLADAA